MAEFDKDKVVAVLNQILEMELAGVARAAAHLVASRPRPRQDARWWLVVSGLVVLNNSAGTFP